MANIYKTFKKELTMNTKQPHRHAALIKAWADGAPIQYRRDDESQWIDVETPVWSTACSYRIKPEEKPKKKCKVALFKTAVGYVAGVIDKENWFYIERQPQFVRWLTDAIEHEAE